VLQFEVIHTLPVSFLYFYYRKEQSDLFIMWVIENTPIGYLLNQEYWNSMIWSNYRHSQSCSWQNVKYYQKIFSSDNEDHRRKFNSKHQFVWTTLKQMCISVAGVKLWNSLQNDLKGCLNIFQFKKNSKNEELHRMKQIVRIYMVYDWWGKWLRLIFSLFLLLQMLTLYWVTVIVQTICFYRIILSWGRGR